MKTLNDVYGRTDYVHLNGVLSERVYEICEKVAEKMDVLELKSLSVTENIMFKMIEHNDGGKFIALVTKGSDKRAFVADTNCCWDNCSQYNTKFCWFYSEYGYREITTAERLCVLNNIKTIVDNLDMAEDEKCEVLRKALGIK